MITAVITDLLVKVVIKNGQEREMENVGPIHLRLKSGIEIFSVSSTIVVLR